MPAPDGLTHPDAPDPTQEISWKSGGGPWVVELSGPAGSLSERLRMGEAMVIGSGEASDVRVSDPTVSGRHCRLRAGSEGLVVEDLGSLNGVLVGSARVKRAGLCADGSGFVIGRTSVCVRTEASDESSQVAPMVPGLVGNSLPMRRVADLVHRYARFRGALLILGESGTGKDVVARACHQLSGRKGAYVPLNVGAVPEQLADAELFGHRRGAFTGAVASRRGAFEEAHGGTLFLDEIAEVSPSIQVKLLRVVEDGQLRAVGATSATRVDVRLISATWAPLEERIQQGRFRLDLFQRLSHFVIELPPLRQRKSDIPELSRVLLARFREEVGPRRLASDALARLLDYAWPGNVRELSSVLYRAAVASDDGTIAGHHVEQAMPRLKGLAKTELTPAEAQALLERHNGNVSQAARAARLSRSTFRSRLERAQRDG